MLELTEKAALAARFTNMKFLALTAPIRTSLAFGKYLARFQGLPYFRPFLPNYKVPETVVEMYIFGLYAWDKRKMQVLPSADTIMPRSSTAPYTCDQKAGRAQEKDPVEGPVDRVHDGSHGKEVSVLFLDLQNVIL